MILLAMIFGITATNGLMVTTLQKDTDYPQDVYQLRSMAVQNRTDINNLDRRMAAIEGTATYNQSNAIRISVLEEQVTEMRRQQVELKAWVLTAYGFGVTQLVALLWLGIRYLLDRTRFLKANT